MSSHLIQVIEKLNKQLQSDKLPEKIRKEYEKKLSNLQLKLNNKNSSIDVELFYDSLMDMICLGSFHHFSNGTIGSFFIIKTGHSKFIGEGIVHNYRERICEHKLYTKEWFEYVYAPINETDMCKAYEFYYDNKYKIKTICK